MIRLIIFAIGIFLIWVLFLSDFSKQKKIIISVAAILVAIAGFWADQHGETPKSGITDVAQIVSCGVSAKHSYRTNFDITFCLENTSENTVKRLAMNFTALTCIEGQCDEVTTVHKAIPVDLAPQSTVTLVENLTFKEVDRDDETMVWIATPTAVKAIR